jgi:hypothetical protein
MEEYQVRFFLILLSTRRADEPDPLVVQMGIFALHDIPAGTELTCSFSALSCPLPSLPSLLQCPYALC